MASHLGLTVDTLAKRRERFPQLAGVIHRQGKMLWAWSDELQDAMDAAWETRFDELEWEGEVPTP
jgi:hypothetical protein